MQWENNIFNPKIQKMYSARKIWEGEKYFFFSLFGFCTSLGKLKHPLHAHIISKWAGWVQSLDTLPNTPPGRSTQDAHETRAKVRKPTLLNSAPQSLIVSGWLAVKFRLYFDFQRILCSDAKVQRASYSLPLRIESILHMMLGFRKSVFSTLSKMWGFLSE